ncbi:cell division ATP-binding protein FtsE [Nesterenkonia lutea]|uniref:Cell division ATP-binding protein FtsE n=1 Tax=Nesterenkonia lutea TaxID=272919 RepID=A0ABR9JER9_9MICC|nr:cell division ATP-binding protein FtsE [Nesterenkonia lutea]MBE1524280.1 cell division transport system ATP-binding protein [Nesterenkonia lutea]
MIRFEQVTRRYEADGRPALDDVTVEFYRGDFAFLIGASGSGKSTLLRMILREGLPQRGKVTVAGQNLGLMLDRRVPDFRRSIGMVFQDFRLLPDKTVFDNVAFAMRVLGTKRSAIRKRVTKVLEKVDLAHLAKRYPHEISGGEQQRAAIARAIVNSPAILLADEPTGNLDPRASAEVMKVLRWINASGTTVIMATHDRAIVDQANSRVVQLHRGRLVRDEPHGFYDAPEGSAAWDVLAQEEGESGLRAHDPAPLKTGVVPMLPPSSAEGPGDEHAFSDHAEEHPDDHREDLAPAPGEDPAVLDFDEDPVLRETTPQDYSEQLEGMELTAEEFDAQLADPHDVPTAEHPAYEHENNSAADDSDSDPDSDPDSYPDDDEHLGNPEDAEDIEPEHNESEGTGEKNSFGANPAGDHLEGDDLDEDSSELPEHEAQFEDEADLEHEEQTGLRVTWPEHLRDGALGHDVPEPHGDFNGTEMPDLEQDGYTEAEDEPDDFSGEPALEELPEQPVPEEPVRQDFMDQEPLTRGSLEESPTGKLAPIAPAPIPPAPAAPAPVEPARVAAPLRRLPPMYPTLPPPAPPQAVSQPAAAAQEPPSRPRLSWLAHAEDEGAGSESPVVAARLSRALPLETRGSEAPGSETPGSEAPRSETHQPERPRPETHDPGNIPAGSPQESAPAAPAVRAVPRPKSSASQSTYTDARRTAEHLGIKKSRRSILRRLRRDV